jgi:hypothetical protein
LSPEWGTAKYRSTKGEISVRFRFLLLAMFGVALFAAQPASAATGDVLRVITAAGSCGVNVGVAFDGTNLYMSCSENNVVEVVSPADGSEVRKLTVTGMNAIGAMAYDKARNKIWMCNGGFSSPQRADAVDPTTGAFAPGVQTNNCPDGLAYDAADDSLWASADANCVVQHWGTDSSSKGTNNVCTPTSLLNGNGNSGIAVGGPKLYLANNGGSRVYEVEKDFSASTLLFQSDRRLEDLECDSKTFAPNSAMWIQDAYDRILTAVEIPSGRCGVGGGADTPPAQAQTPSTPATSPAARRDRTAPRVTIAGVSQAGCRRSAFNARVRVRESALRSVSVYLDGKRIARTSRSAFSVRINARKLRAGRHRIRTVAVDRSGNRRVTTSVFARCAQRIAPAPPHFTG